MIEDEMITGWVEVGGIAVLAEYDPRERWNGWLCPRLDPYAAVTVLIGLERLQPGTIGWTFGLDGLLLVIDLEYVAFGEALDASTNLYTPDADGLYSLGSFAWTWAAAEGFTEGVRPSARRLDALPRVGPAAGRSVAGGGVTSERVGATDWQTSDDQGIELYTSLRPCWIKHCCRTHLRLTRRWAQASPVEHFLVKGAPAGRGVTLR